MRPTFLPFALRDTGETGSPQWLAAYAVFGKKSALTLPNCDRLAAAHTGLPRLLVGYNFGAAM